MYCRSCDTELANGAVACTKCGKAPLNGNAYCGNCGKPTDPAAIACPACGVSLAAPATGGLNLSSTSNRTTVAICAILLGSIGVHKFLLGYTQEGIITCCISLLTCGIGVLPMQIIGIVEGIKYLQMTDQQFHDTYVAQKKGWF